MTIAACEEQIVRIKHASSTLKAMKPSKPNSGNRLKSRFKRRSKARSKPNSRRTWPIGSRRSHGVRAFSAG